jgi:hypothetical protein
MQRISGCTWCFHHTQHAHKLKNGTCVEKEKTSCAFKNPARPRQGTGNQMRNCQCYDMTPPQVNAGWKVQYAVQLA